MQRKDKHQEREDAKIMNPKKLDKELAALTKFVDNIFKAIQEQRGALTDLFDKQKIDIKDLKQFNTFADANIAVLLKGLEDLKHKGLTKGEYRIAIGKMNEAVKKFNDTKPQVDKIIQERNPDVVKENITPAPGKR